MNPEMPVDYNILERLLIDKQPVSFADLLKTKIPEREYLVDKLVPKGEITYIGGKCGSLKSFLAQHLTCCCATGKPLLGTFTTKKCRVVYLDEENGLLTMGNRMKLLMNGLDMQPSDFIGSSLMVFPGYKINNQKSCDELERILLKERPDLVIIDSLIRAIDGDENSARDMKDVFGFLRVFCQKYKTTFVILHHVRKAGTGETTMDDLRGSVEVVNAAASVIVLNKVRRNEHPTIKMTQEKARHEEESREAYFFHLQKEAVDGKQTFKYVLKYDGTEDRWQKKKPRAELAKEAIEKWLKETGINEFSSSDAYAKLTPNGNSRNALCDALKALKTEKKIVSMPKNNWVMPKTTFSENHDLKTGKVSV